jgi:hypothetical protein
MSPGETPRETLLRYHSRQIFFLGSEAAVKESNNGLDDLLQRRCFQDTTCVTMRLRLAVKSFPGRA